MPQQWRSVMKTEGWLRHTIIDFQPYQTAPIQEKYVINANENYLNILDIPSVRADVMQALKTFRPQIYPAPFADGLRAELAGYMGVAPEMILAGNGGDELITYILGTFLDPGDRVVLHQPTFDMYALGAETLGAEIISVPDLPGYRRDTEGLTAAVKTYRPKLTFVCNPNNPTGELIPLSEVRKIAEASDYPVIIDEAYMEFAEGESAVSLLPDHPNIILIRTLSKAFGLAGMRCGYIVAAPETIDAVAKIKNPYNLNSFTQLFASIAVRHREEILVTRDRIISERERMEREISRFSGVTVYPSRTNFILIRPDFDGTRLFEAWRSADILVKRYGAGILENHFRITVTSEEINNKVLAVLKGETEYAQSRSDKKDK